MKRPRWYRIISVAAFVGGLVFAMGPAAFADPGNQPGPTPPQVGDPVVGAGTTSPHGGYSSTSNFCLQCHDVHDAAGEYGLMYKASVTSTCKTCHGVGVADVPDGTFDPIGTGTIGTTSVRTAYDTASPLGQHLIGSTSVPGESTVITEAGWSSGWRSGNGPVAPSPSPVPTTGITPAPDSTVPAGPGTASDTAGGLYCASCHTPHGENGAAVNTKWLWVSDSTGAISSLTRYAWAEGSPIYFGNTRQVLHKDTDPTTTDPEPAVWEVCGNTTISTVLAGIDTWDNAGTATACKYAQINDAEGNLSSLYGYKLLSAFPNHTYSSPKSYLTDKYSHDQPLWCGACHKTRLDSAFPGAGSYHNHPTGCSTCHGNPADGSSADFPHTSTMSKLLTRYPDALCVNCHVTNSTYIQLP